MSIKFIHTSDIHIGKSFASTSFGHALGIRRRAEIKQTFFDVLDGCVESDISLLLIAGDLFEDDYMDMSELKDVRNKFEDLAPIKIVICAGNHDALINNGSCFKQVEWSSNVYIFAEQMSKFSFDDLNVDIYGFSWSKKELKEYSFEELIVENQQRTNILMLHGDIYTDSVYLPLDVYDLLKKGFDYIALGHVHKADYDNIRFAYPGSPEPLDFSETGDHGIIEGVFEGKEVEKRFVKTARRSFEVKKIEIHPEMSFEEIKGQALMEISQSEERENIFRLIIEGYKDEVVKINTGIIKELLETKVYYCEVIDETQSNYDLEMIKQNNADNLIGEFVKHMESRGLDDPLVKDALFEGLNILLSEKVNG